MSPTPNSPPRTPAPAALTYASARGRWVIAAAVLGSGLAAVDATAVAIALPSIGRAFGVGVTGLQWVLNAYTLTLAGLLLLGGSLGDRYGRRRVFVVGTVWFAVASLSCGLAPDATTLVLARALQGVGAALLTPASLALLEASFQPGDRSRAIGAWSGLGGIATVVGPFLGGWLISAVSWRLIFFVNLPLALLVVLVALRHVPESRETRVRGRLDVGGALAVTTGLVGVTYGLIDGPANGWSPPTLVVLCGGLGALVAFVVVERRASDPVLPLELFSSAQFSAANAVTFVVYAGLGGVLFLLPVTLQVVDGYSPLASGAATLPITVIMLALSARSGALAARTGPRLQMSVGPVLSGAGIALLSRVGGGGSYLTEVLPAVTVLGLGLATTVAPLTATALGSAPAEHAGVASAVNNDVARAAGLVAVAVLPVAAGITGTSYLDPADLADGFGRAALLAGIVCAAGGLLAAAIVRNPAPPDRRDQRVGTCCTADAPGLRGRPASLRRG